MIENLGRLQLAQADGNLPEAVAAGSAPGESGVSILGARFKDSAYFSGELHQNLILFPASQITFDCRLADRRLRHAPHQGSLAICPAGIDCSADGRGSIDIAMVVVDQAQLALAASDISGGYGLLRERFIGDDPTLFELSRLLWRESAGNYPNGPLFWSQLSICFIEGLLSRHSADIAGRPEGMLDRSALLRIRQYVLDHLSDSLDIPTLAFIAGRSPFHFARAFARSMGMTPHRYVVQLRLQRAMDLLREKQLPLSEIATYTGFSDQSHLSRWIKRVYGVSPMQVKRFLRR